MQFELVLHEIRMFLRLLVYIMTGLCLNEIALAPARESEHG